MAIDGVAGSGKTFTALRFAFALGQRVAVINTESGAVEKYLGLAPDGTPWKFEVGELADFAPTSYTQAIMQAGLEKFDVLIIDSLSHAWAGAGGALELKDRQGGNSFTAWKNITPMHNRMIESILHSPCHVIATMRSKQEYVLEQNEKGKQEPRKVGMGPVQRAGMEYEFDIYATIDSDHVLKVTKTRCPEITDAVVVKPNAEFMRPVVAWLNDGSDIPASFFAVTDADLEKFAARQREEERAERATQPKKSAMELLKEQAATTTAAASAATPAATTPGGNGDGYSTADQRSRIEQLFQSLSMTAEQITNALAKRKVSSLRSLTIEQAKELTEKLEAALASRQQAASTSAAVDQVAGQSKLPDSAKEMKVAGPCTQEQVDEIKRLIKELEQVAQGSLAKVTGKLKASGKAKLADLSVGDAEKLKGAILKKQLETFIEASLESWAGNGSGNGSAAESKESKKEPAAVP